jgi:hypothetical protein
MPTPRRKHRIFISHATKDNPIIELFIDLILDAGLAIDIINDVFCTSYDGTKIRTGDDWRESIKTAIVDSKVVFLFISPYYKESEVCQNEMGAAWVLNSNTIPFIIEPITFKTVGVITEVRQVARLLDELTLDEIKDKLIEDLTLHTNSISSSRWTAKKNEFILKCKEHFNNNENKYPIPLSRDEFNRVSRKVTELETTITEQMNEIDILNKKVDALKKVKNKEEVKKIENSFKGENLFTNLDELKWDCFKLLHSNPGIINGIIFNDYFNLELNIDIQGYRNNIVDAVAANEIDGEELRVKWTNRRMQKIKKTLDAVESFIQLHSVVENFVEEFESKFQCNYEFNNVEFWRNVFNISVYFN